jgi:hypothetical protein
MLWSKWNLKEYNETNTIIIDDLKEVCESQRKNCILIKVFEFTDKNSQYDTSLKNIERILTSWGSEGL